MKLNRRGFLRLSRNAGVTAAALGVCAVEMQSRATLAAPPVKRLRSVGQIWATGSDGGYMYSKEVSEALRQELRKEPPLYNFLNKNT